MKNTPSLFSTLDLPPFLDEGHEAIDVDPYDRVDDDDADADVVFLESGTTTSDSSHMWDSTWQIPSSTSGLRFRNSESKTEI